MPPQAKRRNARGVIEQIGTPTPAHVQHAIALIASIPPPLADAAHEPFGARAVVYAMLLDRNTDIRNRQLARLREDADAAVFELTVKFATDTKALPATVRLPLVDMAIPTLRELSDRQYRAFRDNVRALIEADEQVDLFEYTLQRTLVRHLDAHFGLRPRNAGATASLPGLIEPCTQLLSSMAYYGHDELNAAEQAFSAGFAALQSGTHQTILPVDQCGLAAVDQALDRLQYAAPGIKKRILAACIACIGADGRVTLEEAELLRAVADGLDCPLPPILPDSADRDSPERS